MKEHITFGEGGAPAEIDEPMPGVITLEDLFRPPDDGFGVHLPPDIPSGPSFEARNLDDILKPRRQHREATLGSALLFLTQTEELVAS